MPVWTAEQVAALAPDTASASAGHSLANEKKWVSVGCSSRAVWGLCQGSGKDPYQARVDLSEPAFKCSCPSRKFPCKHGLGLMLLFAKSPMVFSEQPEPGWVSEWLASRSERAEKKVEKAKAAAEKPVDVEAQAKRAAQRTARVEDGIAGCRVWLEDLVRRGLAAAQSDSAADFERVAARMVDAQAPGLSAQIRRVRELISSGPGWDVRTLDQLGRLHLLLRAGERMNELPADLVGDVRVALGWSQSKEEVLSSRGIVDQWVAVGQTIEEEDRIRSRRTWLVARSSRRHALVLDFAAGLAPLPPGIVPGTEFSGEVVFYPACAPLRAQVKEIGESGQLAAPLEECADETSEAALRGYAEALAVNPWLPRWPILLRDAHLSRDGNQWTLVDKTDRALPLRPAFQAELPLWRLLSGSGGQSVTVFAEWDGESALPLGGMQGLRFFDLGVRGAA